MSMYDKIMDYIQTHYGYVQDAMYWIGSALMLVFMVLLFLAGLPPK